MKRRKLLQTVFAAVLSAAMITGCGKSYDAGAASSATYAATTDSAASYEYGGDYLISNGASAIKEMDEMEFAEEMPVENDVADAGTGGAKEQQDALSGRKLIKTVSLNVETEQFDVLVPALEQRVTALGGYIESISSDSRGNYYSPEYIGTKYLRYANMTARIPKENLDAFLSTVSEQTNVVSRSESVTDVTLQYVDLESHKKALNAEQDRLLELMERAESVEDIITIEGRLSEVRYQLESMESQLRTFDNKIDYSTVYLYIDEVEQYTPTETTTVWQRISSGFMESLRGVGRGISNFAIWLVVKLPYLVVWALAIIVIILIIRAVFKSRKKRLAKKYGWSVDSDQSQDSADDKKTEDNSTES